MRLILRWFFAAAMLPILCAQDRPELPSKTLANSEQIDVRAYGIKADGRTDDTRAMQAAIDAAATRSQSTVLAPYGHICIKTGPVVISAKGITLKGGNRQMGPFFDACGADASIFLMKGFHDEIRDVMVGGSVAVNTTHPAVQLAPTCVECEVRDSIVTGGNHALDVAAPDFVLEDVKAYNSFGSAIIYTTNGGYIRRVKADQEYPVAPPPQGKTAFPVASWAATTAYAANALVQVHHGDSQFILQVKQRGTTGSRSPAVLPYGQDIKDGTVVWRLVSPATYYSIQADTGTVPLFISDTDMTGSFTAGLALTKTFSGPEPQIVQIRSSVIGETLQYGVYAAAGSGISMQQSLISNCRGASSAAIYLATNDNNINDNLIYSCSIGVNINTSGGSSVVDNMLGLTNTGVLIGENQNNVIVSANRLGSVTWGHNENGISVLAGAGDYLNITNNDCAGLDKSCIVNKSKGRHNTLSGNH